MKNVNFHIFIF